MTARERRMKPKEPIPEFKSRQEEAEFWDTHDLADYWDEFKPVKVRFARNLSEASLSASIRRRSPSCASRPGRRAWGRPPWPGCGSWSTCSKRVAAASCAKAGP